MGLPGLAMSTGGSVCQEWTRITFCGCHFSAWCAKVPAAPGTLSSASFGGLCWSLQLPRMALKVEMDPSAQPYLPRVSLCVPWRCLPLHPAKTAMGEEAVGQCLAMMFEWDYHFLFPFLFFPIFPTLACFPPFLKFPSLSWPTSYHSFFTCPLLNFVFKIIKNKTTSQQQWLWHNLKEPTEDFSPSLPFPVAGRCCSDVLGWESWPLTFQ